MAALGSARKLLPATPKLQGAAALLRQQVAGCGSGQLLTPKASSTDSPLSVRLAMSPAPVVSPRGHLVQLGAEGFAAEVPALVEVLESKTTDWKARCKGLEHIRETLLTQGPQVIETRRHRMPTLTGQID